MLCLQHSRFRISTAKSISSSSRIKGGEICSASPAMPSAVPVTPELINSPWSKQYPAKSRTHFSPGQRVLSSSGLSPVQFQSTYRPLVYLQSTVNHLRLPLIFPGILPLLCRPLHQVVIYGIGKNCAGSCTDQRIPGKRKAMYQILLPFSNASTTFL